MWSSNDAANQLPQNSRQIQPSICHMGQAHYNQKIQYFCLEDGCQLQRQLCKYCLKQQHVTHKVARIDKLIPPLSRLGRNTHTVNCENDYHFFQEKLDQIENEWEGLYKVVEQGMNQLKDGILMEMNAVKKTFSSEEVDRTHDLLLNSNSGIEEINQCIKILNFLDKRQYLDDVQTVRGQAENITKNVTKIIKKSTYKIGIIMQKMHQNIKRFSFSSPNNLNVSLNTQQSQRKEQQYNLKKEYHDHEDSNESFHQNEAKGQIQQNRREQHIKQQKNTEQTEERRNERKNQKKLEHKEERCDGKANQRDLKKREQQNRQKKDSQYILPGKFPKTQVKPKKMGEKLLQNDEYETEEPNTNLKNEIPNPYIKNNVLNPSIKTNSKEEDDFRRKKNK